MMDVQTALEAMAGTLVDCYDQCIAVSFNGGRGEKWVLVGILSDDGFRDASMMILQVGEINALDGEVYGASLHYSEKASAVAAAEDTVEWQWAKLRPIERIALRDAARRERSVP